MTIDQNVLTAQPNLAPFGRAINGATVSDKIALLFSSVLITSTVVIQFPEIDRWVSGVFYDPHSGFWLQGNSALLALRWMGRVIPVAISVVVAAVCICRLLRRLPFQRLSDRGLLFASASIAIGPGLIVNAILKSHWGRARPIATDVFGGSAHFTPAWWPWGECASNCSFVSGEVSAAAVLVCFVPLCTTSWKMPLFAAVGVWTLAIALNRMAFGAHYFSDVTLSALLTFTIVYLLKIAIFTPSRAR